MQSEEHTNDEYSSSLHHHLGGCSAASHGGKPAAGLASLLPSTTNQPLIPIAVVAEDMRVPFTISQRHELERQNMVFEYLTAYSSVPADPVLPFSRNSTSQTNGMDQEPWRCRRTDGKKWRCGRDVRPDKKFCERHVHKSRKCSRKHVEIESNNIEYSQQKDNPLSDFSRKGSAKCDQTSCNQEQKQQRIRSSAGMGLSERDCSLNSYQNPTVLQQQENDQDKQETIHWNPYTGDDYYPYFDPKVMTTSPQRSPTRHFMDAWPSEEICSQKESLPFSSGSRELPLSSLTLSMSGGEGVLEDSEGEAMKPHWAMSNSSWLNSTGGPLGEALCPSTGGKGTSHLPSLHGSSNSFSNTSSCSKGSCEEGSHQFNFFG